jgi:hypothetical protein
MRTVVIVSAALVCTLALAVGIFASGDEGLVRPQKPVIVDKTVSAEPSPKAATPLGAQSPKAAESSVPMANDSPLALFEGIIAAREREDRAWLARTLESTAGKASITEDDCHAAWRNYLWEPALWNRIAAAHRESPAQVSIEGEVARVSVNVGGNAGEYYMLFKRVNGAWYLLGA